MILEKNVKTIEGEKKNDVFLFALSTCGWCKMTKEFLKDMGIEYSYVDVDLLDDEDSREVEKILKKFKTDPSFPKIIIDEEIIISGFDEEAIKKHIK